MPTKTSKLNTVLLVIVIAILGYMIFFKDGTNVENSPILEEKSKPAVVESGPKTDLAVTLLRRFINNENAYLIKECNVNGQRIFVNDSQATDGPATFFNVNGDQLESCGGFTSIPIPENSMCRTALPSCTIVFNRMDGAVSVDIYSILNN